MKTDLCLSTCTNLNSKLIKDFNIKMDNLRLTEEKMSSSLESIDTGKDFLSRTPGTQAQRPTSNKQNLLKLSIFSVAKDDIIQAKGQEIFYATTCLLEGWFLEYIRTKKSLKNHIAQLK